METIFLTYDKWGGLIPLLGGIYISLIAYKVINPNKKNPEKMEVWRDRFGTMAKVIGPSVAVFGIISLSGFLSSKQNLAPVTMHRQLAEVKDPSSGWYFAQSTKGKFSVLLPIPFNDFTITTNDPKFGNIKTHAIGSKTPDGFQFTVTEIPKNQMPDFPKIEQLRETVERKGSKLINPIIGEYHSMPCITYEMSNETTGAFTQYIQGSRHTYILVLEFPSSEREGIVEHRDFFFSSFKLKKTE